MDVKEAKEIIDKAVTDYEPYAIVAMVSGGDDSLTVLELARNLGVSIDFVMHVVTGTGVKSTTEHVRQVVQDRGLKYIEADAGKKYETYVRRKGFFGIGHMAHGYAYHVLKQQQIETALSQHIRRRARRRHILLLNGARITESRNRRNKMAAGSITPMGKRTRQYNIWVSPILNWTKRDCLDYLRDSQVDRCPAAKLCHRSAECMCGTMQSYEEAEEVAFFFPEWAEWWHNIRDKVKQEFSWDWGEDVPPEFKARKNREKQLANGQLDLFDDWLPMCTSCESGDEK